MPRSAVNVGLGLVLVLLFVTGTLELLVNGQEFAWLYVLHRGLAIALAPLLVWKAPIVWRSFRRRGAVVSIAPGSLLALLVAGLIATGSAWIAGWWRDWTLAGNSVLGLHLYLYYVLPLPLVVHALLRWHRRPLRSLRQRRVVLRLGLVGALGLAGVATFGLAAATLRRVPAARRFTGSLVAGAGSGNDFPVTAFLSDDPMPIDPATWRLAVTGRVRFPVTLAYTDVLGVPDALVATVDCTGGWAAERRWSGQTVGRLLDRAVVKEPALAVRFRSKTGYWTLLPIAEARAALIATHVGGEPLAHGHGFPARLVVPGRRGFQWVKWLDHLEVM